MDGGLVGAFYVIGTPIGNLEDITYRAARILGAVPLVAAEDTRVARRLLAHLGAAPRLVSCHEHNWRHRLPELLAALEAGDAALVTDAGAPAVSDPGAGVIAAVADAGYPVVTIPGVSAVTAALAVAGLPADRFLFLGFLPRRRRERMAALSEAAAGAPGMTLVVFEAPHRLRATLSDIIAALDNPQVAVCRELTKLYEEVRRGDAQSVLDYFSDPRGEFTIVIATGVGGNPAPGDDAPALAVAAARVALSQHRRGGMHTRDAVARVAADTGLARRTVYALWLETAGDDGDGGASDAGGTGDSGDIAGDGDANARPG